MNTSYWRVGHKEPPEREDMLVGEILKSVTGDDGYPGDTTTSGNWPGVAPGTRGILNALSPKYCNWSGIVDIDPKPPILWTHGAQDIVVADGSPWELGTLGSLGAVPGWPGADAFPPQPMVQQIRAVLTEYEARGGSVEMTIYEESGHFPPLDARERWSRQFFAFLEAA
jgi:pimeloyl-ACP methyl ester carboxylesterase